MTAASPDGWGALLGQIGATPSEWRFAGLTASTLPDWQIQLAGSGLDVSLDDITIDHSTGLYLFKGQQVLIYIKFANKPKDVLEHDRDSAPRFHMRDCRTIERMKNENRYQRYVAIARTDGRFPVTSRELDGTAHDLEAWLGPCKNCLGELNYKRYRDRRGERQQIWSDFSIEEFFTLCSSSISTIPIDSCSAVDPRQYAENWSQVSEQVRQKAGWQCGQCRVLLNRNRRLLHVHHIDRDKTNNWQSNLLALCILCHRAQPQHANMYARYEDELLIKRLRQEQGLIPG